MTNSEAIEMLKAKLKCMEHQTSGMDMKCNSGNCDNCDLCYLQGNWEEQKEYLKLSIEALKQPEIIYCKDCKYYESVEGGKSYCCYHEMGLYDKDYCSYAERKDD